jgi:putative ABC transport system permease protein
VEGALAADSLLQAPRRTSSTVAALCLSLALVIGLAGVAKSSYQAIHRWTAVALNPDLFVTSSESLTQRSFRFPPSLADDLRAIPGVEEVQPVRTARILYNGVPVMLIAADVRMLSRRFVLDPVSGDPATMYERAARGEGVIISDNFSLLRKVGQGDALELMSPSGPVRLPVLGITVDYSDQQGSFLIDRALYRKYWNDDTIDIFRLYVAKGASVDQVRQAILSRLGGHSRIFVFTNDQLRDYILKLTEQWFGLTYVQIFVAVLVAVLGIVNTLTVSITDRRRELGVLQAVGAVRSQVRHTIWMEALTIGILGLILGFALGAINLYYILEVTRRDLAGLRLDYLFPLEIAASLLPIILAAAFLAALGPAESAVRAPLVQALEYE